MAQKTILIPGEVVDRAIDAQAEGKDARESINVGFLPAAKPRRSRRGESPPGEKSRTEHFKHQTTQSKDVWNENLEFFMSSAVCLLSAECLLFSN